LEYTTLANFTKLPTEFTHQNVTLVTFGSDPPPPGTTSTHFDAQFRFAMYRALCFVTN